MTDLVKKTSPAQHRPRDEDSGSSNCKRSLANFVDHARVRVLSYERSVTSVLEKGLITMPIESGSLAAVLLHTSVLGQWSSPNKPVALTHVYIPGSGLHILTCSAAMVSSSQWAKSCNVVVVYAELRQRIIGRMSYNLQTWWGLMSILHRYLTAIDLVAIQAQWWKYYMK